MNESASSVPKDVLGIRILTQNFKEANLTRSMFAIRGMYGVTSKLSVFMTGAISNHHDRKLPPDLINHTHVGNQTNYYAQVPKRGVDYPYLFSGIHLYAKYRFVSIDKKNSHVRVAGYGEWSKLGVAHDEAEPNLMDDTGGYGYGVIATVLKNRFAVSFTSGLIKPNSYSEMQPDLTGGPDLPTTIHYGDALRYDLSFGYRLAPVYYTDYNQVNWNVYLEFRGRIYNGARVIQNGVELTSKSIPLAEGSYLEVHPGIQRIVKSNLRFDFSVGFSLYGKSYVRFTPVWELGIQRYFYRK